MLEMQAKLAQRDGVAAKYVFDWERELAEDSEVHAATPDPAQRADSSKIKESGQKPITKSQEMASKDGTTAKSTTSTNEHGASEQAKPQPTKPRAKSAKKQPAVKSGIRYVPQADLDGQMAKFEQLSRAALAGNPMALDQIRTALDQAPHVWLRLSDLQVLVEQRIVNLLAGNDPLRLESFRKRASDLRQQLSNGFTSMLAQMAASRAVTCWLFTQLIELRYLESAALGPSVKQLEQAERRFQVAVRTLRTSQQLEMQIEHHKRKKTA